MFHESKYCTHWELFYEPWVVSHRNRASHPWEIRLPSEEHWKSSPNAGNANAISVKIVEKPSEKGGKSRDSVQIKISPPPPTRKNISVKGGEKEKIFQAKQTFLIHNFPWTSNFIWTTFTTTWWALMPASRLDCFYSVSVPRKTCSRFILNSLYAFSIVNRFNVFQSVLQRGVGRCTKIKCS